MHADSVPSPDPARPADPQHALGAQRQSPTSVCFQARFMLTHHLSPLPCQPSPAPKPQTPSSCKMFATMAVCVQSLRAGRLAEPAPPSAGGILPSHTSTPASSSAREARRRMSLDVAQLRPSVTFSPSTVFTQHTAGMSDAKVLSYACGSRFARWSLNTHLSSQHRIWSA